jgi:hypothetical protein
MLAVTSKNLQLVEYLLMKGALPNEVQTDGLTALHLSAIMGEPRLVKLLRKYGADENIRDKKDRKAIELVASNNKSMLQAFQEATAMSERVSLAHKLRVGAGGAPVDEAIARLVDKKPDTATSDTSSKSSSPRASADAADVTHEGASGGASRDQLTSSKKRQGERRGTTDEVPLLAFDSAASSVDHTPVTKPRRRKGTHKCYRTCVFQRCLCVQRHHAKSRPSSTRRQTV